MALNPISLTNADCVHHAFEEIGLIKKSFPFSEINFPKIIFFYELRQAPPLGDHLEFPNKISTFTKKEIMNALENIKNSLIDRILATRNEQLLEAIKSIFDSTQSEEIISLSTEQIEMLYMSEKDIEEGKLVSESELSKRDSKWLS